jgi:hypothetical protein
MYSSKLALRGTCDDTLLQGRNRRRCQSNEQQLFQVLAECHAHGFVASRSGVWPMDYLD